MEGNNLLAMLLRENHLKGYLVIRSKEDLIAVYDIIAKKFKGSLLDYLLFSKMYEALVHRVDIPSDYLKNYFSVCKNENYKSQIKAKIAQVNTVNPKFLSFKHNDVLPYKKDMENTMIDDIIKESRGGLILLDFWASWCSPCREEMPYLEKLKAKYKSRNIRFISLSFDKDVDAWRDASAEEMLQNSYLVLSIKQSEFINKYAINFIPRYILVGKDGEVINANPPHPGDAKLEKLLEQNL